MKGKMNHSFRRKFRIKFTVRRNFFNYYYMYPIGVHALICLEQWYTFRKTGTSASCVNVEKSPIFRSRLCSRHPCPVSSFKTIAWERRDLEYERVLHHGMHDNSQSCRICFSFYLLRWGLGEWEERGGSASCHGKACTAGPGRAHPCMHACSFPIMQQSMAISFTSIRVLSVTSLSGFNFFLYCFFLSN